MKNEAEGAPHDEEDKSPSSSETSSDDDKDYSEDGSETCLSHVTSYKYVFPHCFDIACEKVGTAFEVNLFQFHPELFSPPQNILQNLN